MSDYSDPPEEMVARMRVACAHLPEIREEKAWAGTRWKVRQSTFAHILGVDRESGFDVVLSFRAEGADLDVLRRVGHPFFALGWGRNAMGMVLDEDTDWDEVAEIVTDSYCMLAPNKLVALVDRPELDDVPDT